MAEWFRLAGVDEIPEGSGKELTAGGRVVALFRVEDNFYALDGVCPHAGGPLGNGTLIGCVVTCPWHGWQFDVSTGQHSLNANIVHTRFSVKVENNGVYVEIS